MNCPYCGSNHTQKASKLAYVDGVYFCLDCAIYFPSKKLEKELIRQEKKDLIKQQKKDLVQINIEKFQNELNDELDKIVIDFNKNLEFKSEKLISDITAKINNIEKEINKLEK